mmetsp:Transcript_140135/g.447191  ORF Transcript_140135/g.447191 Transcript_140135/m.447191 type:complete len:213 (-) Transcript_140135:180-818(-)
MSTNCFSVGRHHPFRGCIARPKLAKAAQGSALQALRGAPIRRFRRPNGASAGATLGGEGGARRTEVPTLQLLGERSLLLGGTARQLVLRVFHPPLWRDHERSLQPGPCIAPTAACGPTCKGVLLWLPHRRRLILELLVAGISKGLIGLDPRRPDRRRRRPGAGPRGPPGARPPRCRGCACRARRHVAEAGVRAHMAGRAEGPLWARRRTCRG